MIIQYLLGALFRIHREMLGIDFKLSKKIQMAELKGSHLGMPDFSTK